MKPDLLLFDLDGTLITSYMDNPDRDYHVWAPYPGTAKALENLRREGIRLGVITNQAGIGFGYNPESDWIKKRNQVCHLLGFRESEFFVCFAHPKADPPYNDPTECRRRKPSGGMIFEAMEYFGRGPDRTVFVGDMDSDRQAALHARVDFAGAGEFFDSQLKVEGYELERVPVDHPSRVQPVPMPSFSRW